MVAITVHGPWVGIWGDADCGSDRCAAVDNGSRRGLAARPGRWRRCAQGLRGRGHEQEVVSAMEEAFKRRGS